MKMKLQFKCPYCQQDTDGPCTCFQKCDGCELKKAVERGAYGNVYCKECWKQLTSEETHGF